jgi:pimeloyl-ACP methyl ester carboxylesterase
MLAFGIWQMARPDQVVSSDTPAHYKLEYKTVTLRTADGYDIAAWDVASANPSDDAIVVLSGYAADKGSILPRTAFLGQKHRLLYLDFRSFGQSSGRYSTMGLREVEDALAGVRYLKEQGVKRIGIYGFTMGGAVALMTAAREPSVMAVVTEDAYSDFGAVIAQPYGYLGPAKPLFGRVAKAFAQAVLHTDADAVSPAAVASSLRIPALVIHSSTNPSVPVSHADLLKARMSGNQEAKFWYTDGKTDLAARTEFAQTLLSFFDVHLGAAAPVSP